MNNYKLKGSKEFYPKLNIKTYNILLANSTDKINKMINIFKNFIKSKYNNKFIGLDFEFKRVTKQTREIALMQINLEFDNNKADICIFYPPALNTNQYNVLIKLLTNKDIIKVIHGSESLDIPYLFNQLFKNNKKIIFKFINNLFDTKYLCEYFHIENNIINKCSIYDLLLEFNIITKKKYKLLNNIENITGPVYTVTFDINNLSKELLDYALYDVLFLPELIKKFLNKNKIYTNLIPEISRIIFFHKRNITNDYLNLDTIITKYNNYFIKSDSDNIKLNELYYIIINNIDSTILKIIEITYFKKFLELLIKLIIYQNIYKKKYSIFINNNTQINFKDLNNIDYSNILLKKYVHYDYLIKICNQLNSDITCII